MGAKVSVGIGVSVAVDVGERVELSGFAVREGFESDEPDEFVMPVSDSISTRRVI